MGAALSRALLVPTKLTAPQPRAAWVRRERLLAQLDQAPDARMTLVVAPAGFGKSTLVAQWLLGDDAPRPASVAWLTLDEHDQDSLQVLAYMAGAIARAAPGALATSLPLLGAAEPPPAYVIVQALLVDLSALPGGLTLVLDDYHLVTAEPVHRIVAYLLRHLPGTCRLVVVSRSDPPLPLARLRAEQRLVELRAGELRLTEAETGALLRLLLGATPAAEVVAALHQQTEGWAIALQLAALAHMEGHTPRRAQTTSARQIAEYLADEVFDRQPAAVRRALLALAVPERFCAELGAALLGAPGELAEAEGLLEQLVRANLFLIALDHEGRWYRFHHLFRDLLLRRLRLAEGPEALRTLRLRAAGWLAEAGLVEEAVRLYLAAGADDAAADLVERQLLPELNRDVASVPPGYWLRLLPAALIERRPGLALIMARLAVFSMDMTDFQARLAHVDALLADPAASSPDLWPTFRADLAALRGVACYWQGRADETIRHMRSALALGPSPALAVQALLQLGMAYVGSGAYAEGVRLLEAGLPEARARLGHSYDLYQYSCLATMHQVAGELAAQERDGQRLAELVAERSPGDLWAGYAAASLGIAAYERSDLDAAARHFGLLASRKYRVSYPGHMGGLIGLALVALARGELAVAAAYEREARAFADEAGGAFLRHQALGCATRLALARGDLAAATASAGEIGADMHLGLSLSLETPRLSRVRALVAAGGPGRLAQAEEELAAVRAEAAELHNRRLLVAVLGVEGLLRAAQGRAAEAQGLVAEAARLGVPRGFVRSLADLGPELEPLLRAVAGRDGGPTLGRLLSSFGALDTTAPLPATPRPPAPELLTRREAEILGLLAERWTDKEIAARLVIAPNTVRKHTSTIYDKLGVGSRREAVDAARALGLLPSL